jgi:hypothetical protein
VFVPDFSEFWSLYPRKIARAAAEKFWKRLSEADKEAAMQALPNHIAYWDALGTEKQYIPHASTFIHQRRFEDELEMPVPKINSAWWTSETETQKIAAKLGLVARGGEDWSVFRQRISEKLRAA